MYESELKRKMDSYIEACTQDLTKAEIGMLSLGYAPKTKEKLVNELKKQGYNAASDLASVGGKGRLSVEGYDPLMIFDKDSYEFNKNKSISDKSEMRANYRYKEWLGDVQRLKNKEKDNFKWRE